jgi:HD-GYP domain-containing protein (c-di-GMP phosphodiesterase class II)
MPFIAMNRIQVEMSLSYGLILAGALLGISLLILWYVFRIRKNMRRLSELPKWLNKIRAQNKFENKLAVVLDAVSREIVAPTYAFYIWEERFNKFRIRASRFGSTGSYASAQSSGLAASAADAYSPGYTASKLFKTNKVEVIKEGEVPLLVIPIGSKGIVRIGPIHRSHRNSAQLKKWLDFVNPMLIEVIEAEQTKEQSYIAMTYKQAVDNIAKIALEPHRILEEILPFCVNTLKADGGCLVKPALSGYTIKKTSGASGLNAELCKQLEEDTKSLQFFQRAPKTEGLLHIHEPSDQTGTLPPYFKEHGIHHVFIVQFNSQEEHYFMFWYKKLSEQEWFPLFQKTLIHNVEQFKRAQDAYLQRSGSYILLLQALARLLDDLSPNSVGYSELMSRYSVVIAKQLGLPDHEIRDVAMAAYLSHIGAIALSSDLFQKEGEYTDKEFALMKLHADVSGSIVAFATGNERAASYIRYHHERMDGNGYPEGLKGEEIPRGARIISVVQALLARLNGRSYRDPISFHQALQTIKAAAGMELDTQIVNAFDEWYSNKRRVHAHSQKSLGECHEMCCVPESICKSCPAFSRTDVNCWEIEGVLCKAHGKSCETCFVRTEYISRNAV